MSDVADARREDSPEVRPAEERPAQLEDRTLPGARALPDFLRNKRHILPADAADKESGGYFTGLPLVNSDPDTGIGFGARVLYFHDGAREDALFDVTPYRHRAYAQAFFTTNGYQFHTLDYDAPYLGDTPYRLRASLIYEKNIAANYFGLGDASLGRLTFPGAGKSSRARPTTRAR